MSTAGEVGISRVVEVLPRPEATRTAQAALRDPAFDAYQRERREHWDSVARRSAHGASGGYHRRLARIYQHLIPAGQRILELGCARGDLLAALRPSRAVGIDFSPVMIAEARRRHPTLTFLEADAHDLALEGPFDSIILSDLVNDAWDVQRILKNIRPLCTPRTRVIINAYSRLWGWPLGAARRLGLAQPLLRQNWLTAGDITNLLHLAGLEVIRHAEEVLWPLGTPLLAPLFNRFLVKLWPLKHLALTNILIARPSATADSPRSVAEPTVSVIVPARNEAGNIPAILERIPSMGPRTEVIFVEGHSSDDTWATLERSLAGFERLPWALHKQKGKGKADAVRTGFGAASGDILMILDADLTVPPEDLPRFYEALRTGAGEFVNGVRLVYPMERQAMRSLNLLGNKLFSLAFSWILGQPIKDTLCGTKALWRADYERLAAGRAYFGDFDPFGDFDLIFGASKLNLRLVDLPIRYRERTYGDTNIQRWRHGLLLARMCAFAARRLKFV